MPDHTPSPLDLHQPELEKGGLGWTFGAITIAALFLLATNAVSLRDWIDDQPPGPVQAQAAELTDKWVEAMDTIGVGLPRDAMHSRWKGAEQTRFQRSLAKS